MRETVVIGPTSARAGGNLSEWEGRPDPRIVFGAAKI